MPSTEALSSRPAFPPSLVADRVELERELERKNERLEEFASIISRDLRSPVSVAEGYLDRPRADRDTDHHDPIERALGRMEALTRDLPTQARQGQSVGQTEPIALDSIPGECWQTIETETASLEVTTGLVVEDDGPGIPPEMSGTREGRSRSVPAPERFPRGPVDKVLSRWG